jgi:hypothetical protein
MRVVESTQQSSLIVQQINSYNISILALIRVRNVRPLPLASRRTLGVVLFREDGAPRDPRPAHARYAIPSRSSSYEMKFEA